MNKPKYYQNYHKHTSLSHRYNKDSALVPKDYFKHIKNNLTDIPQIYSTVEHGWQGNYFKIYDDLEKFNKEMNIPIKFIFGVEAYWVIDRFEKDSANNHIVLLAKNDNGRKKINRAIYESFKTGYYYKGRMDLDILLSLPKDDVFVTTACVGFWTGYKLPFGDDEEQNKTNDEIVLKLFNHFTDFYLELQPHDSELQKNANKHIMKLHEEYNIPIISGVDSHYINQRQKEDRDDLLKSNNIHYDNEDEFYNDFPTIDELIERFKKQGIVPLNKIYEAIENTNKTLDFEDIVLNRSLKVPIANKYKHLSQEERNEIFKNILRDEWKKQIEDINKDKYDQYIKEINHDIKEIIDSNMADYFIDNYEIMKLGQEKYGGILTPSGRGSSVSMYLNKLLRLTKVDKINSPVLMYSERFLTSARILESKTPPDIDHNVSSREPFIQAQKDVICEEGTFDLIALGTLHYKSAFKMYARAYNLDPTLANEVTKQITKYENDLKYIEDEDEKDLIDIFDYVDKEKYGYLIDGCQEYMGIIDNVKSHPCGTICYDGDAIEDIGVIMVKSESQGENAKETFVTLIESGTIDSFGYLKQDYLIVDSIGLTYEVYKDIGIEPMTVNGLLKEIEGNNKVWDIYKDGHTMCINQAEQPKSTQKVMRFAPKNISETTQWIAGIRPAFKSMYKIFENREHFDYGIKAFDELIQDEYCDSSFILYQEHLMKVLSFAGFEVGETYNIIKAISKKKEYVIKKSKEKFIPNFAKAILETKETENEKDALSLSEMVWTIVENSASYGFNCVSKDTRIKRSSPNGKFEPTVEEMYKIMNDISYAKETNHYSLHQKYNRYGYGTALSMGDDEIVRENKIIDITPSGIRQTYKITTRSGSNIICTDNHKFPTKNGEIPLSKLNIGDELYCIDKYKHKKFDSSLTSGDYESNIPTKGQMGFQNNPKGASVIYNKTRLYNIENRCYCEICKKEYSNDERFELHHKDLNRKNNNRNNFQWLCVSCHKKEHYKNGRTKRYENGIPTFLDEIISIEPYKIEQTYNVEMADPNHNFISSSGLVTSNSAHAYCMAIDSITLAWQKAHYPLEFYKVALQWYTRKGKKDKVSKLKMELPNFNISLESAKFGSDNRVFTIVRENNSIIQALSSVKDMQKIVPIIMYNLGQNKYENFFCLLSDISKTEINKRSLSILIHLDYFSQFGHIHQLLSQVKIYADLSKMYEKVKTCKSFKKSELSDYFFTEDEVSECCDKVTDKMFKDIDNNKLIKLFRKHYKEILDNVSIKYPFKPTTIIDKLKYEVELLGYTDLVDESVNSDYYIVLGVESNNYGTKFANLYHISSGMQKNVKLDKKWELQYPLKQSDIIDSAFDWKYKGRYEEVDGKKKWIQSNELYEICVCWKFV